MKLFIEDNLCTIYKLVLYQVQKVCMAAGFELAESVEEADILLAGVCAAFEADEKRSMAMIARLQRLNKPLFVYGCLTRVRPELFTSLPVFASWEVSNLVHTLTQDRASLSLARPLPTTFRQVQDYRIYDPQKVFIAISTGCSFDCSFCPHKKGAGFIRSIPRRELVVQAQEVHAAGAKILVLTGIDTACYGDDLGDSFTELLQEILEVLDSEVLLHIAQFNPEGLFHSPTYTRLMLDLFSDPRVRDIQLPMQTASPRLLKLMNRHYDPLELKSFLTLLRANNPEVMLRTDLLVGFPTETEAEWNWSIALCAEHFNEAAVYGFEMKPGLAVAAMGLPQIPNAEIQRRVILASNRLKQAGLLVHGGGQRIGTLKRNDRKKQALGR